MTATTWVVVEGADGTGKSTLAKDLAAHLSYEHGATVLARLRQHSAEREYIDDPVNWQLRGLHVVQDRSLLSRIAYQPVLLVRGAEPRDIDEAKAAMASVRHRVAVLYLTTEEDDLVERVEERGDAYFPPEATGALLKSYWRTMAWWESVGGWSWTFDTTGGEFPTVDEALLALSQAPMVRLGATRSSTIQ